MKGEKREREGEEKEKSRDKVEGVLNRLFTATQANKARITFLRQNKQYKIFPRVRHPSNLRSGIPIIHAAFKRHIEIRVWSSQG